MSIGPTLSFDLIVDASVGVDRRVVDMNNTPEFWGEKGMSGVVVVVICTDFLRTLRHNIRIPK